MKKDLLTQVLVNPEKINELTPAQWTILLSLSKSAFLFSRLYRQLCENNKREEIPQQFHRYADSEKVLLKFQKSQIRYEVNILNRIFEHLNIVPIYLKGTAYNLAKLELSIDRLFSDIDILLAKNEIDKTERSLKCDGWATQKTNDYDQQYYRLYMHEIPPIQHIHRGTVLDIHHNILPVCGAHPVNISLLTENAITVESDTGELCKVFAPNAMFIHASVHLFNESEYEKGLRDLTDLASMYVNFGQQDNEFDKKVIELARQTELTKAIYHSLNYINKILDVELSDTANEYVQTCRKEMRFPRLYDFIFTRVLIPHHKSCNSPSIRIAKFLAYWRGHLLRMPLKLLIPHLCRKSLMQLKDLFSSEQSTEQTPPKF